MIIIPEIETVLLQPPRTGSTVVRDAVLGSYAGAFPLYRHMEFDGIPLGYRSWRVVSQVREPKARLESLFQYMANPRIGPDTDPTWVAKVRNSTLLGFDDWLLRSDYVFSNPAPSDAKAFRPIYQVMHVRREQIKSQALWAKHADDLIFAEHLAEDVGRVLGIGLPLKRVNESVAADEPIVWTPACQAHLERWHAWDLDLYATAHYHRKKQ